AGEFEHFDRGGVAWIYLDGPRNVIAHHAVHAEKALELEAGGQGVAEAQQSLLHGRIKSQRSDAAAILKRSRVQPGLPDELTRDIQQGCPALAGDKHGRARFAFDVLLEIMPAGKLLACPPGYAFAAGARFGFSKPTDWSGSARGPYFGA